MALSNKVATGPFGKVRASVVLPDFNQNPYPYLWAGGIWPISTTTPGTDTACADGTLFISSIFVPHSVTFTGATNLIGSVGGTDKVIYALWDQDGAVLAYSAVAGTTVGNSATLQTRLAFTDPVTVDGPGIYFVGCQFNGTTAKFRSHAVGNHPTTSQAGTFGTIAAITTVPTTFTADKGPVMGLY